MTENLPWLVLGVPAVALAVALGWFARTFVWQRGLSRKQRFFGLPEHSECLLVVNRDAATAEWSVARNDVFALLELSAVVKECGANGDVISHDMAQQSFGERTEFCIGGPVSNRRMAAHLQSLLPGVHIDTETGNSPDRGAFTIGGERHLLESGVREHVLLARLTAGQSDGARPVFLFCGQRSVTNQAAARYLARHHGRLMRKYGTNGNFCVLLRVVNSQAYGADVVELVADVTRAATAPPASKADPDGGGRRGNHRAKS
ncbi:hypothetical protein DB35_09005 [Streptomyces abyssalis]|uniref:Secreted protein n=1 Tax=Streptomyces abyssalis TaxID=933944 RepID=A0A1E7JS06_9ACTN|nr:hypothetical protein [Streptomyces abyssalis]OEU91661.1 hypothetical protein AN215_03810 [Streptomyces abyssalis]OEU94202.1 hypothetical protein DB35_09005 [Streptomyces abyssalis]